MGYEEKEVIATCDSCGSDLAQGDMCWTAYTGGMNYDLVLSIARCREPLREYLIHYCCITPCLERAVVKSLRSLHESEKGKTETI